MEKRLRQRLAELGWNESLESCLNIAWLYLIGAFDPKVVQRFVDEDGSAKTSECEHGFDHAWVSTSAMLDEAARVGRLDDLAPPSIKTPEQILSMLARRRESDEQEPRVRTARRKGLS